MAYKNRKHNKRHIQKLRNDPSNWRNRSRWEKKTRNQKVKKSLTLEEMEEMIAKL